ncbi:PD-(D/E)XK nuclease domain-containing protein [Almyronema epifaneia]|uniref:7-cyano-7-deazaguanine synthase n=1 Tax=Almyronema epifaneia S1 TaxID=2991925 RepID=A0ABW6IJQ9_9CYAN
MIEPRLFLCGEAVVPADDPLRENCKVIELCTYTIPGKEANVNLRLEDLAKVFEKHLTSRLKDLLEIAAYIFSADCSTSRGRGWIDGNTTESWGRDFQFIIPVRDLDFWQNPEVQQLLSQILRFLSDDKYTLNFQRLTIDQPEQLYLEFDDKKEDWPFYGIDRVLMFSGGLDSLAGAIETATNTDKLVLVSHRSVTTMNKRLRNLVGKLRQTFTNVQLLHIPVWVNKDKNLGREATQRTRSFLFSALGAVVAESVQAGGVSFFENGIVSLNLPVADEVVRARASRTTHPYVLDLFSKLYSLVTEREFVVDNPYLFKTKAEVINTIASNNGSHLISQTCSCAHQMYKSKNQLHCGTCSQCIDRRIAIISAQQENNDPEIDYVSNVFSGERKDGYEKNMAVNYVRHAFELSRMSDEDIAIRFNRELSRAVRHFPKRSEIAQKLIEMHRRHGDFVKEVVEKKLHENITQLIEGSLEKSSMLSMVFGQQHQTSSWRVYAERVVKLLSNGIPISCKTKKPENEPHLQEICDGILRSQDDELIREFPFMRWSSSLTKPDWSFEDLQLWVELKYVRKRADIRRITEDIAADITKYGDNDRYVLYVVYDPSHLITNEAEFSAPIHQRETMMVYFLR